MAFVEVPRGRNWSKREAKRLGVPITATMEARDILAQYYGKPKRHKYRAEPTIVDGIRFASKREAERYRELLLLVRIGEIFELELQPRYPLHHVNLKTGEITLIGHYVADFRYAMKRERYVEGQPPPTPAGSIVVEDSKGFRTRLYRWKKKMFEAEYNDITLREV